MIEVPIKLDPILSQEIDALLEDYKRSRNSEGASYIKGLKPIPLGSSRDLRIGQTVYAIGNPFGLQRTLTKGLVSALDRELPTANFREVVGVIQTDAAINPGNSGGPLLDSAGRLIGVNSAIRSASGSSSGIGFAIPADLVNRVVPALISRGHAPLPGIGVTPVRPDWLPMIAWFAVIAALGLVPFLFATGPGSEIQRPLAIVVIGGLVSATALTLLLLPSLFRRFGIQT